VTTIGNSTAGEIDKRYATERRFFPHLDELIEEVDKQISRGALTKAQIKSYCLSATGGSAYFSCAACGFHNAIQHVAHELNTTPATVGLAFESHVTGEKNHGVVFMTEPKNVERAQALTNANKLSEITRVRLSCRAGIGLISLLRLSPVSRKEVDLKQYLDRFMDSEIEQMRGVIEQLEEQLSRAPESWGLACERVRHGVEINQCGDFGKACWREHNRLLAAGHDRLA
jgi:hypothetical protein